VDSFLLGKDLLFAVTAIDLSAFEGIYLALMKLFIHQHFVSG